MTPLVKAAKGDDTLKTKRYGYTACERCGKLIHSKSERAHQLGAICTTRWFAKHFPDKMVAPMGNAPPESLVLSDRLVFDGLHVGIRTSAVIVDGRAKVAPPWAYAVIKSLPPELHVDAVKRCLEDPQFAKAVDTLAITTANAYTTASKEVLELFESRAERARRIARDRAERNEKLVRSELRSLEKERTKLDVKIKALKKKVAYYDRRRAQGQGIYTEDDVKEIRRQVDMIENRGKGHASVD